MTQSHGKIGVNADLLDNKHAKDFGSAALEHAAVTLGGGSDPALSLTGQVLTLADVLTPTEHTNIGTGAPHHAAVTLDTNADTLLSLSTQALGLDVQYQTTVLAGPTRGVPVPRYAVPTFRTLNLNELGDVDALGAEDHDALVYDDNTGLWASEPPIALDANADTLLSLSVHTLGLDTQAKNTVLAGPTTGSNAVPAFRALDAADMPATYLKADGTVTGASSQAQTFTNGIIGPSWKPASDSATALQLQNSSSGAVVTIDTTNKRVTFEDNIGVATPAISGTGINVSRTGSAGAADITGIVSLAQALTNGASAITGMRNDARVSGAEAQTGIVQGGVFRAISDGAGATSFMLVANYQAIVWGAGNVTTARALNIDTPGIYSSGTLDYAFGLYIQQQKVTGVSLGWGLYQQGSTDTNVFEGQLYVNGGLVVNDAGENVDFRVESDTEANMLFLDASANTVQIGGSTAGACLTVGKGGSLSLPTITKAVSDSPYSVAVGDYTIRCNAVGGAMTVALPEATGSGRILNIKKIDASVNAITVDAYSTNTIDGAATVDIGTQYANMQIQDAAAGVWDIL